MVNRVGPNQERYLLAETTTAPVYMMPLAYRIRGPLDRDRLRHAIQAACDRHDVLHMRFERLGTRQFVAVRDPRPIHLEYLDADGSQDDEALRARIVPYVMRQPDLSNASMQRFHLTRLAPDDHLFILAQHHSVSDGVSQQLFAAQIFAAYDRAPGGEKAAPYSAFHVSDWDQTQEYREALDYWSRRVSSVGASQRMPRDIAIGWSGPPSGHVDLAVPAAVEASVRAAAKNLGVSTFTFIYAATTVLMGRATGSNDVASTFQSNGRRALPGSELTVGPFSNALLVGEDVCPQRGFADLAASLKRHIADAIANEVVPFHRILQLSEVQPSFGINSYPRLSAPQAAGLAIDYAGMVVRESDFDINFRFFLEPGSMSFTVYYDATGFSRDRIALMSEQLVALLGAFAAAPLALIGDVPTPGPRRSPAPDSATPAIEGAIHQRFVEHARRTPDRIALVTRARDYTYGELLRWSSAAGAILAGAADGPVGILAPRGPALIAAMIGAARCGRTFAVLDPDYPDERLSAFARKAGLQTVLAHGTLIARAEQLVRGTGAGWQEIPELPDEEAELPPTHPADQTAYLLFTSGSTGEPKCIATGHEPLVRFIAWQAETFAITADDRVTMLSGLAHDPVMRDIFLPLSTGAQLAIPEGIDFLRPGALGEWLAETRPTVAHLTPPLGRLLVQSAGEGHAVPSLRWLFFGGDVLTTGAVREMQSLAPAARAVNFYGSTETPQAISYSIADPHGDAHAVPLGTSVPGFAVEVEDERGEPLARNEQGDIVVRSAYLSLGYVEQGELRPHPFEADGTRYYKTGDRGYLMADGGLQIVGRSDDQVKIRGFRVEPAEVAREIAQGTGVMGCKVLSFRNGKAEGLAAFVVMSAERFDPDSLRAEAAERLPAYMVPVRWYRLDTFPLMPNGKLDRTQLRQIIEQDRQERAAAVPQGSVGGLEGRIIERWRDILGLSAISPRQNFAELGGDSLSYVEVSLATEQLLGTLPERWETMAICDLAALKQRKLPGFLTYIDTPMILRALAIALVVAGHFQVFSYGGGATTAMFLVAGFLMGRLQIPEVMRRKTIEPLLSLLVKVVIPVWLYSLALFASRIFTSQPPSPFMILLLEDFVDYSQYTDSYRGGHDMFLWYVHCFLQMIAFVAALAWLNIRGGIVRHAPMQFALALLCLGVIGRFFLPAMWVDDFWANGVAPQKMENYLPTTHLGTLAIGMVCALASRRSLRTRLLVAALVIVFGGLSLATYPSGGWMFLIGFGLALLFLERLPFMRVFQRPLMMLSGATLFIYLTHFHWRVVMQRLGVPDIPEVYFIGALLGGILVWAFWQRLQRIVRKALIARRAHRSSDVYVDIGPA